ncbi:MAG: TMEM175 family protein, partial [Gemmatimonadota bacterium]|nr:TMEM175 family protein [Gemmatimonadota bacterium]
TDVHALLPVLPKFLGYALSFVYVAIYWNNHHHLMAAARTVSGRILWLNMLLLFCLSIVPFTTAWMTEHPSSAFPVALYGMNLLACAIAFTLLLRGLLAVNGPDSGLAAAIGNDWKGNVSLLFYIAALPLAYIQVSLAFSCYIIVATIWFIPDPRLERILDATEGTE